VLMSNDFPMRINKYLAHQGFTTRREADELIEKKLVTINGKLAVLGDKVNERDTVTIKDERKPKKRLYLSYYKPRGIITHGAEGTEEDITTKLSEVYGIQDVFPIGRLDKDSEGLIIVTNDGRITGPLLEPERDHEKEYIVTVDKKMSPMFARRMSEGVDIEGYTTKPARVELKGPKTFSIILTEGKKHQIRRMCAALGFQVKHLVRIRIMNIGLGELKPNQYREIKGQQLALFLSSLGLKK